MSKEIEKLIEQIILSIEKATQKEVPEEVKQNIRLKCSMLPKMPEIRITSNPQEFDSHAKMVKNYYQGTWDKSYKEQTHTDTLFGDYQSGLSQQQLYNNNSKPSTEMDELSDFSMNKMQVALSTDEYDEYNNTLVIYIPEVREYDVISYKEFTQNKQKQALFDILLEKTNGKVSEEELHQLAEKFDFSNGIPEIEVISDPEKFDKAVAEIVDEYSDDFENDNASYRHSTTLHGDYQSGFQGTYESRGTISSYRDFDETSDFNLNGVQVILVNNNEERRFYNSRTQKDSSSIVIYLPEREYEEQSFKTYVEKRKTSHAHNISEVAAFARTYIPQTLPKDFKGLLQQLEKQTQSNQIEDERADKE